MTKEEKIQLLFDLYGFNKEELEKRNENQIDTLLSACKDEDGNFRTQSL